MKCTSCDSELKPGARFCDACGAPVEEAPAEAAAQQPASPYDAFPPAASSGSGEAEQQEAEAGNEDPFAAFQLPPAQPVPPYQSPLQSEQPAASFPTSGAQVYGSPSSPPPSGEKILGMPADQMGNISLGLGGAGCLFSITVCGGLLFGILGLIAGFLSLRTSGRRNGTIGLVLSALGVIVALALICGVLFFLIPSSSSSNF